MKDIEVSKFLSLVLRHQPEKIDLTLDLHGWAKVDELLHKMELHGMPVSLGQLIQVVETNSKQRFMLSPNQTLIRANQGHSLIVDVELLPAVPPALLYHGTASRFAEAIQKEGITKQSRLHVHLSADPVTAQNVGSRHGKPFIFLVKSGEMHQNGLLFYLSANHVWLTDYVPPQYLEEYKNS